MLSGRAKKDYAREAQAAAAAPEDASGGETPGAATNGTGEEPVEALVAM